jgi:hypothetical protein
LFLILGDLQLALNNNSGNEEALRDLGDRNFTRIKRDFHDIQVGKAYFVFRAPR